MPFSRLKTYKFSAEGLSPLPGPMPFSTPYLIMKLHFWVQPPQRTS